TSRKVVSATEALDGFTSTAIRTAFGTKSCRSRNRLAANSELKKLMPVALPPGRARLATRPSRIGSAVILKTTTGPGFAPVDSLSHCLLRKPDQRITTDQPCGLQATNSLLYVERTRGTGMNRNELLLSLLDVSGIGLEIGAGYDPLVPKSSGR